jgi:valyl-tRNA synthetase
MMLGLHFMDDVPFRTVYVHALVRDASGQKMSKSKGNIIDPLELIDRFGGDALRFTLASLAAPGRDIKLSEARVEGSRNFATKLWNAARFCEMNECASVAGFDPASCGQTVNRWIVGEVAHCAHEIDRYIAAYRFNDAAQTIYQFIWGSFCDWYVEFSKSLLNGDDVAARDETRATTGWAMTQLLRLLHPFMPFITEELWTQFGSADGGMLITEAWPDYGDALNDDAARSEMGWVIGLISGVRSVRAEMNVPPAARIPLLVTGANETSADWLSRHGAMIERLARLSSTSVADKIPVGAVQLVHGEATAALPIADVIDIDQEKARLQSAITKSEGEIGKLEKKLGNQQFLAKAPKVVVEEQRERLEQSQSTRTKLVDALERLAAAM